MQNAPQAAQASPKPHKSVSRERDPNYDTMTVDSSSCGLVRFFFGEEAAFSYPLHILDPAPGPNPGDFPETIELCRNPGIDGAPPPEPGEPWIIF